MHHAHLFVSNGPDNSTRIAFQPGGGAIVIAAAIETYRERSRVRPPAQLLSTMQARA
jgi:hypothetical protein